MPTKLYQGTKKTMEAKLGKEGGDRQEVDRGRAGYGHTTGKAWALAWPTCFTHLHIFNIFNRRVNPSPPSLHLPLGSWDLGAKALSKPLHTH